MFLFDWLDFLGTSILIWINKDLKPTLTLVRISYIHFKIWLQNLWDVGCNIKLMLQDLDYKFIKCKFLVDLADLSFLFYRLGFLYLKYAVVFVFNDLNC